MMHETTIDFFPQKNWDDAMARFEHCAVAESCKHRIGLLGRSICCFPRVKPTWLSIRVPSMVGFSWWWGARWCQVCRPCSAWKWLSTCTHLATSRTLLKWLRQLTLNPVVSRIDVNCNCFGTASFWGTQEQRLPGILAFLWIFYDEFAASTL